MHPLEAVAVLRARALEEIVRGKITRFDAVGIEARYPAGATATPAYDVTDVLAALDGIVVCDTPPGVVRSGDHVVVEQRWRVVNPSAFVLIEKEISVAQPETVEAPAAEPEAPTVTTDPSPA